jgi:hypothetical protein
VLCGAVGGSIAPRAFQAAGGAAVFFCRRGFAFEGFGARAWGFARAARPAGVPRLPAVAHSLARIAPCEASSIAAARRRPGVYLPARM